MHLPYISLPYTVNMATQFSRSTGPASLSHVLASNCVVTCQGQSFDGDVLRLTGVSVQEWGHDRKPKKIVWRPTAEYNFASSDPGKRQVLSLPADTATGDPRRQLRLECMTKDLTPFRPLKLEDGSYGFVAEGHGEWLKLQSSEQTATHQTLGHTPAGSEQPH